MRINHRGSDLDQDEPCGGPRQPRFVGVGSVSTGTRAAEGLLEAKTCQRTRGREGDEGVFWLGAGRWDQEETIDHLQRDQGRVAQTRYRAVRAVLVRGTEGRPRASVLDSSGSVDCIPGRCSVTDQRCDETPENEVPLSRSCGSVWCKRVSRRWRHPTSVQNISLMMPLSRRPRHSGMPSRPCRRGGSDPAIDQAPRGGFLLALALCTCRIRWIFKGVIGTTSRQKHRQADWLCFVYPFLGPFHQWLNLSESNICFATDQSFEALSFARLFFPF